MKDVTENIVHVFRNVFHALRHKQLAELTANCYTVSSRNGKIRHPLGTGKKNRCLNF